MYSPSIIRLFVPVAFGFFAVSAAAQTMEDVSEKFNSGEFLEAAELGEAVGTSDGYAMAARALAVYGHYLADEDTRLSILERGIELSNAAIEADTASAEAYRQAAHVIGRYAENIGIIRAAREGVAGKIRDALLSAIELDPDHAEAHAAFGSWCAEISSNRIARWIYGNYREEAIYHFDRILELEPITKEALYQYGTRIQLVDSKNGKTTAREILTRASEIPAHNVYNELLQEEVLAALAALD